MMVIQMYRLHNAMPSTSSCCRRTMTQHSRHLSPYTHQILTGNPSHGAGQCTREAPCPASLNFVHRWCRLINPNLYLPILRQAGAQRARLQARGTEDNA